MEHITLESFEDKVQNSDKPVIIDFYADWCGPCRRLGPIFQELSEEIDSITFAKVDVEKEDKLASQLDVRSIPTLIVFKGGEQVDRFIGLVPKEQLKSALEKYTA